VPRRRAPVAPLVIRDYAAAAGERGQETCPDPGVNDARVEEDERRTGAPILIPESVRCVRDSRTLLKRPSSRRSCSTTAHT
jgi:hypothetical protein